VIEILVLRARALHAAGSSPAAAATLREALVRAAPEGHVRVFVDAGPPILSLLHSAALDGPPADLARRVLDRGAGSTPVTAADHGLVDDLSSRERDVLRLLRTDLSGPDIARELYVSLNTLRTHTKSIYTKLGVNSRRAAVRRADELGL
jgi:LuxR family maltose regulon positive regulatory protein